MQEAVDVFEWALTNVYREGDRLHVVHVVPDVASMAPRGFYYPEAYQSSDLEDATQCLSNQAEDFIQGTIVHMAKERGIEVNLVIVKEKKHKHIGKAVCEKAEELEAAPLVLATHDKSYFERMLLGSISNYCLAKCKRPVLLLHPNHSALSY